MCLLSFLSFFSCFLITKAWKCIFFQRDQIHMWLMAICHVKQNSRDFSLLVDFVVVFLFSGEAVHSTDDSAVQGSPLLITDLPPFAPFLNLHVAFRDGYAFEVGWNGSYTDFFHPFFESLWRKKQKSMLSVIIRISTIFLEWIVYSGHFLKKQYITSGYVADTVLVRRVSSTPSGWNLRAKPRSQIIHDSHLTRLAEIQFMRQGQSWNLIKNLT